MIIRPSGVSFLSFIYIIVGMIGLIVIVSTSQEFNYDVLFNVLTFIILIISSIALYLGKKWGWWIIAFVTLFSILGKIAYVYMGLVNYDSIPDVGKYFLKHAGKMLIQSLILIYLFQQNVNSFFNFENSNKLKRFGIILSINILAYVLFFVIFYIIIKN